jgi:IclR family transcriptional regulator, acetate operon repressor
MSAANQGLQSLDSEGRRTVQSVDRACAILQVLAREENGSTTSELGRQLGVHKSTASRMLAALDSAGMVERDPLTGRFHLGLRILTMAGNILSRLEVLRIADPLLRRLAEATQETVNLGIRFGNEVVNIEQIPGPNILRSFDWIGKSTPLHRGSLAKALLAHLSNPELEAYLSAVNADGAGLEPGEFWSAMDEIRRKGYAVNRGELNHDVYAVGAPVFDSHGRCHASLSVAGYCQEFHESRIEELGRQVIDTAATISRQLGHPVGRYAVIG